MEGMGGGGPGGGGGGGVWGGFLAIGLAQLLYLVRKNSEKVIVMKQTRMHALTGEI